MVAPREEIEMASMAKILAAATAAGARDEANRNPDNAQMQKTAKHFEDRAKNTK